MKTKEDFRIEKSKHPFCVGAYYFSVQEFCEVRSFSWSKFKFVTKKEWLHTDAKRVQNGHYIEHIPNKYNTYDEAVKAIQLLIWQQDLNNPEFINI
ncbi:MAG: hypothetical protein WC979_03135 [Candidatus Pacearchaeota archaeon]|jgi:hypothetical protein|nr:hypothetical protein [Clostridia bacterium]